MVQGFFPILAFSMIKSNQNIFVWNCRGSRSTSFFRYCKQYMMMHNPKILVNIETHCEPMKLRKVFKKLDFEGFL